MSNTWNDELKIEAREMYLERISAFPEDERPSKSTQVVEEIAEELGFTKNSVRATLQRMKTDDGQEVYIRAASKPKATPAAGGSKRVSKADAHLELRSAITDAGGNLGEDFEEATKTLTGKAALVIAGAIRTIGLED